MFKLIFGGIIYSLMDGGIFKDFEKLCFKSRDKTVRQEVNNKIDFQYCKIHTATMIK